MQFEECMCLSQVKEVGNLQRLQMMNEISKVFTFQEGENSFHVPNTNGGFLSPSQDLTGGWMYTLCDQISNRHPQVCLKADTVLLQHCCHASLVTQTR